MQGDWYSEDGRTVHGGVQALGYKKGDRTVGRHVAMVDPGVWTGDVSNPGDSEGWSALVAGPLMLGLTLTALGGVCFWSASRRLRR